MGEGEPHGLGCSSVPKTSSGAGAHALGLPVPEFISLLLLNDVVRRLRW